MLSAICLNLDQSKILLSGNVLILNFKAKQALFVKHDSPQKQPFFECDFSTYLTLSLANDPELGIHKKCLHINYAPFT